MSTAFGAGLIACGQRVRHNVVILAETRSEWLVAAYGCMKYNIPSEASSARFLTILEPIYLISCAVHVWLDRKEEQVVL
jgi:hypothetical protein